MLILCGTILPPPPPAPARISKFSSRISDSRISYPSISMFVSRPVKRRKAIFPMSSLLAPKDPKDSEDSEEDKYTAEEESTIVSFVEKVMQKIPKEMQVFLVTLLCGGAGAYVLIYLRLRFNDLTAGAYIRGKSEKGKVVLEGEIIEVGLFSTTLLDCNNKIVTISNLAFEGEGLTISKYKYWKVTVTLTLKTFKKERLNRMIWAIRSRLKGVNYGITIIGFNKLTDLNKELLADLNVALRKICGVKEKSK
ncbi:hypothetical protein LWI28_024748 [Acer negundo]|uniref:Uncharacterized protein n=1 Tax=Acer negundo TaxID=4023 RepID=A0AAD5J143_ACENE|nr:hypothetical protein LWI28_024748 [Acer negundo]